VATSKGKGSLAQHYKCEEKTNKCEIKANKCEIAQNTQISQEIQKIGKYVGNKSQQDRNTTKTILDRFEVI
jgi:hypothetical protein